MCQSDSSDEALMRRFCETLDDALANCTVETQRKMRADNPDGH